MPRVFKATEIEKEDKEIKLDYLDRHMPHVFCPDTVKRGEKFEVKVKLGDEYPHPDEHDHFISVIQLWYRETLFAEARYLGVSVSLLKSWITLMKWSCSSV